MNFYPWMFFIVQYLIGISGKTTQFSDFLFGVVHSWLSIYNLVLDLLTWSCVLVLTVTVCCRYMAPERIQPPDPTNPDYDIRADVWSLGVTLVCTYHLLFLVSIQSAVINSVQQYHSPMAISNCNHQWQSPMAITNGNHQWQSPMAITNGISCYIIEV